MIKDIVHLSFFKKVLKHFWKSPRLTIRKAMEVLFVKSSRIWPDKLYLKIIYRIKFGRKLNLDNPQTFNEKLNWEKLYYHNPIMPILADKYLVKDYIKKILGEEYVVPMYGVYDSFDEIDFESLPNQFVIKCTHDSSGAIICRDKSTFDIVKAKSIVEKLMKRNWYFHLREWVYKKIRPRIIIDKFLDDDSGTELRDYKFWCFNGEPKIMYLTNKGKYIMENFYDMCFRPVNINHGFPRSQPEFEKPKAFDEMKKISTKISKDLPFVRVDFFYVDGQIYFGECTFYDWGGMQPFEDFDWDKRIGSWMDLPPKML